MSVRNTSRTEPRPIVDRLFRIGFWVLVGSICFSVAGMLFLKLYPPAMAVFGPVYSTLVKAPTWTYMTVLGLLPVLMYGPALGRWQIALFFGWGCLIGAGAELIGTTGLLTFNGIPLPFGEYQYTEWLGPKIGGHVPYFIPPSWFAMSVVSLDLARRATLRPWTSVLVATLFMVLWDVSLDPAMNRAFPFWNYGVDGFFFGMPFTNWLGWFGTSLVIVTGYEVIGGDAELNSPWAPWVYVLNCLFPLSISLLQGLYLAALIGALTTALPFLVLWGTSPSTLRRSITVVRS